MWHFALNLAISTPRENTLGPGTTLLSQVDLVAS